MRKLPARSLLSCVVPVMLLGSAQAQSPTLSASNASAMAQEAITQCRAAGYHVSVTIVDSGNFVKAVLRDDEATLNTLEVSKMKATTVILTGRPSGPPANLAPGAPVPPPTIPGTIYALGGVPIKAGEQIIGAIAVSGAPGGDKDAACATAAIAKVMPSK